MAVDTYYCDDCESQFSFDDIRDQVNINRSGQVKITPMVCPYCGNPDISYIEPEEWPDKLKRWWSNRKKEQAALHKEEQISSWPLKVKSRLPDILRRVL